MSHTLHAFANGCFGYSCFLAAMSATTITRAVLHVAAEGFTAVDYFYCQCLFSKLRSCLTKDFNSLPVFMFISVLPQMTFGTSCSKICFMI